MKINHNIVGEGPCIVLLHGLMENLHIWDSLAEQLSSYFKVIQIDLPGHGDTPVVGEAHPMDFMAQCVNAVIEAYEIKECVMVGHSMGGYVTAAFASMFPEKLRGFCFFHSHVLDDADDVKQRRERIAELVINGNAASFIATFIPDLFAPENREKYKEEIDVLINSAKKMDPKGIATAQLGMRDRLSSLELLVNTNVPVLFIIGKQDPRISLDKMMAQATLPKHSEVLLLEGVGHMGFIEAKQKTNDVIESFADRCFSY